jgi:IS5 family transposase
LESEIESGDSSGDGGYRLPPELEDKKELQKQVTSALEELRESKIDHLNPCEREARLMPCDGKKRFAYNAQTVVDESSGMIVSHEVVNEANDQGQLVAMLEKTEQLLGSTAEDTVADKGYRSQRQISEAESQGHSVLVSLWKSEGVKAGEYHASRFEYDAEQDYCICPEGQKLEFEKKTRSRHGEDWEEKIYRCSQSRTCPVAGECSQDRRGRKITLTPHSEAMRRQRIRQQDPGNREKLSRKRLVVERVFGELKQNQGFRRWSYRTLEGVRTQWSMVCLAHNLRKLYSSWKTRQLVLAP